MAYKRKKTKRLVIQSLVNMLPNLVHLVPLPTMEGKLQSLPPSSLTGFQFKINNSFPRFWGVSQEALTPLQHSDESRKMNQCPPRDATCHIESKHSC